MNITSAQYTKNKEGTGNDNIKATIDGKVWFVPLLTKSLQEALARIDTLEAEVAKLKG